MRSSRPLLVAAAALAALAAGLASPAASYADGPPGTPVSPYSVMTIQGPLEGGSLGAAQSVLDGTNSVLGEVPQGGGTFFFRADPNTGGNGLLMWVSSPTGSTFTPGTTYTVDGSVTPTTAGLDLQANGGDCGTDSGTLTVQDATYDSGTGDLATFAMTYSVVCGSDSHPYSGEVRWNSATPYAIGLPDSASLSFPQTDIGVASAAQTVTITGEGPTPLAISGAASLAGPDPDSFVITADGCKGATLNFGDTCTVSVQATPQAAGALTAVLAVPDNSAAQLSTVALSATGFNGAKGAYHPVSPHRILDTRNGTGATKGQLAGGSTIDLAVDGHGSVPASGVSAVVLNVTVQSPTAKSGYITAYPDGKARPIASNINYTKGWTGANLVTVPVGTDGKVRLYNNAGHVSLIADVAGWYAANDTVIGAHGVGESFQSFVPDRILDTRLGGGKLPGGYYETIPLDFRDFFANQDANADIKAFAVNVTATNATASGYLTAFNGSQSTNPTTTSTVNFRSGITVPNMAIVPTSISTDSGTDGWVQMGVYNSSSQPVDVVVDLVGVYATDDVPFGLRFQPLSVPTRIVDTRSTPALGTTKLGTQATHVIAVPATVAGVDTFAIAANVTAAAPSAKTYVTVWPDGVDRPTASNLNPRAGISVANAAAIALSDGNLFDVYNNAGSTALVVDVDGTFQAYPPSTKAPAAIRAQARPQAAPARSWPASLTGHPVVAREAPQASRFG